MLGLRLNRLGAAIQSWLPQNLFVGGGVGALYDLETQVSGYAAWRRNLLTYSEQFDNAAWVKQGTAVVTANSTTAPDGATTADTVAGAGTTSDRVEDGVTVAASTTYVISIYVKNVNAENSKFHVSNVNSSTSNSQCAIAWAGSAISSLTGTGSTLAYSVSLPDNWYRVYFAFTTNSSDAGTSTVRFYPNNVGADAGSKSVYIWGAQLEVGTLTDYQAITNGYANYPGTLYNFKTTAGILGSTAAADPLGLVASVVNDGRGIVNQVTYSEQFDNAVWIKTRSTVTANATTAPDGTTTADKIVSDATAANTHDVRYQITIVGGTTTLSIYAKQAECGWLLVELQNLASQGNRARAWFDLTTGVVGTGNTAGSGVTYVSHSITSEGDGWYRCELVSTTALTGVQVWIEPTTANNVTNWNGNSVDGAFVWGAQLNTGATALPYQKTGPYLGGTLSLGQATAGSRPTLRFEPRGGVRNLLQQSNDASNAAWNVRTNVTLTPGVSDPFGGSTAITMSRTSSASSAVIGQTITGSTATNYVGSWYVKTNTGSGTVELVVGDNVNQTITLTASWQRLSKTYLTTSTTVRNYITLSGANTDTIDICYSQLELGTTPSELQVVTSNFLVTETGVPQIETAYFDGGDWMTTGTTTIEDKVDGLGVVNLLKYTNRFNILPWAGADTTVTANTTAGPDGEITADTITEGTAGNASWSQTYSTSATGDFTGAISVKYNGTQWREIHLADSIGNTIRCWFDVLNGVMGATPALTGTVTFVDQTMTAEANGFYRCTVSGNFTGVRTSITLSSISASADASTTRVNNASYYYANAQLEAGATASTYQGNDGTLGGSAGSASLACVPDQQWTVGVVFTGLDTAFRYLVAKASASSATLAIATSANAVQVRAMRLTSHNISVTVSDQLPHAFILMWDGTTLKGKADTTGAFTTITVGTDAEVISEPIMVGARTFSSPASHYIGNIDPPLLLARALSESEANQWLNTMKAERGTP